MYPFFFFLQQISIISTRANDVLHSGAVYCSWPPILAATTDLNMGVSVQDENKRKPMYNTPSMQRGPFLQEEGMHTTKTLSTGTNVMKRSAEGGEMKSGSSLLDLVVSHGLSSSPLLFSASTGASPLRRSLMKLK